MTNEELKNIIARHVCNACEFGHDFDGKCDIGNDYRKCNICGEAAEALISAGIGDVKEAEHRAEVAEKALKELKAREQSVCIGTEWKAVVTDEDIDEVFGICNPDEEAEK